MNADMLFAMANDPRQVVATRSEPITFALLPSAKLIRGKERIQRCAFGETAGFLRYRFHTASFKPIFERRDSSLRALTTISASVKEMFGPFNPRSFAILRANLFKKELRSFGREMECFTDCMVVFNTTNYYHVNVFFTDKGNGVNTLYIP